MSTLKYRFNLPSLVQSIVLLVVFIAINPHYYRRKRMNDILVFMAIRSAAYFFVVGT